MYFWDKHKTITTYYELLSGEVCDRYGLTQNGFSSYKANIGKLENKGFIERIQSEDNKKHIEIALLDQAEIIIEAGLNAQKQFAQNVLRGLTEEETRLCIRVFDKICNNAEEQLKNDKENES